MTFKNEIRSVDQEISALKSRLEGMLKQQKYQMLGLKEVKRDKQWEQ